MSRFWSGAGTLILLSFVTSSSLNYARLKRERGEERRLHTLQCGLLRQIHTYLRSSSSGVTFDQQREWAARLRALNLDPVSIGIPPSIAYPHQQDAEKARKIQQEQTSWSTVFFGGPGTSSKIRKALSNVGQALWKGEKPTTSDERQQEDFAERAWIQGKCYYECWKTTKPFEEMERFAEEDAQITPLNKEQRDDSASTAPPENFEHLASLRSYTGKNNKSWSQWLRGEKANSEEQSNQPLSKDGRPLIRIQI